MTSVPGQTQLAGRRRALWVRGSAIASVALFALVVLWLALERILGSSRGLDLSDEGLYLLAADPPNLQAAWGFPFGWHTRPLFWLVGHDIATFRTLGAVVLVVCTGWLGWVAARTIIRGPLRSWRDTSLWFAAITPVVGGIGSLVYYASMLRTPSYNWLNIVGIAIASAATLTLVSRDLAARPGRPVPILLAAVSSFALFATFPAKPTTLPLMLVLSTGLLLMVVGWRTAARWAAWNVVLLPVWLVFAVLLRIWPTDFLQVFKLALQMPAPDPLQTSSYAVRASLLLPQDLLRGFADIKEKPALLLMVALVVLAIPVLKNRHWIAVRLIGFGLATLAALAIAGVPIRVLSPAGEAIGLAHAPLTTASIVMLIAALLMAARLTDSLEYRVDRRLRWAVIAFLALLAFVFSFGSGNGIHPQAAVASGFILLAAAFCLAAPHIGRDRLVLVTAVLLGTVLLAGAAVASGWRYPYRSAPLADQQVSTAVGTHGSELMLDQKLADTINGLREQGMVAGWQEGTPLVDVSYTWNPSIGYALGAKVPNFLQLTIFGYSAAHDITDFHLTEPYRDFPFHESWLLTTRNTLLDPGAQGAVTFTMDKISAVSGRAFPASYACVAAGDFVLWRPVDSPEQARQDCDG
ncbi:MAG: hypothetical protein Q7K25_05595 [Actinomycetota bacterium]|nr:hypothetical protein [Actinomycetota bacterium]